MTTVGKYTIHKSLRPHMRRLDKIAFLYSDSNDDSVWANVAAGICWVVIIMYNIQLVIMAFLNRHSTEEMVNASFLLLTTLSALLKQIAFAVKMKRIKHLFDLTDGELFSPKSQAHIDLLDRNEKSMARLYKFYIIIVFTCCGSLYQYPMINRMMGLEVNTIAAYFPFDTSQSPIFELASTYLTLAVTFQGYVNLMIDCVVVTFYAQCKVQLSILKYDLEHLLDDDCEGEREARRVTNGLYYKDSDKIENRFVHCVKHHQLIKWYVAETQSITSEFMVLQIAVAAWTICMTTYKIVGISINSAEFATVALYLVCILTQLFLYCYHGSQVLDESQFVSLAAYCGDWLSLSPVFRRKLLIFMISCTKPIVICAAKIVPIQLSSYIAVLRASYTLFTFLNKKNS